MNHNQRIGLHHTMLDALQLVGEGNPGATMAMLAIGEKCKEIDPDSFVASMGAMGVALLFDSAGIYGSDIYALYRYVCEDDAVKLLALDRANHMGQLAGITDRVIREAIKAEKNHTLDFGKILLAVRERLPNFAPGYEMPESKTVPAY